MSSFLNIVNKLSSVGEIYTTPFLNFNYKPQQISIANQNHNIETIKRAIKTYLEKILEMKQMQDALNQKMLKEKLSEKEMEDLTNSFSTINSLETKIQNLEIQKKSFEESSEEYFFNK